MSDGTITRRDVKHLEEDADLLGAMHERTKAFGDRMPHGEAVRKKTREYQEALAEAQGRAEALRRVIPDGHVRL